MRVLYIGNKLSKYGFIPTTVETLGKQLEEIVNIVTVSDKKSQTSRLFDMVASVIRNRKVDYVIIDTYSSAGFYYAFFASLACRLFRLKYIPILHGGNLPHRLDTSPKMCRMVFCHSYINVSPSGYLYHAFKERGYDNLVIIPNNIYIGDYKFTKRESFRPRLLWVRSFDKTYNCEMAVEVLHYLSAAYPDAKLCMVGPDKDGSMQRVKDLAEQYGVSERLVITGKLSKQEWHKLSEEYDIFISTTNFDNTPVSVIEAMALGLPVVSTKVGGVPYLINDGEDGLLCGKGNAPAMVERINQLVFSPEKGTIISANARKKVESFDWSVVKEQWRIILA